MNEAQEWKAMRVRRLARVIRAHANAIIDLRTTWSNQPAWVDYAANDHATTAMVRAQELVAIDPRYTH